jgi:hypothetical protein
LVVLTLEITGRLRVARSGAYSRPVDWNVIHRLVGRQ